MLYDAQLLYQLLLLHGELLQRHRRLLFVTTLQQVRLLDQVELQLLLQLLQHLLQLLAAQLSELLLLLEQRKYFPIQDLKNSFFTKICKTHILEGEK